MRFAGQFTLATLAFMLAFSLAGSALAAIVQGHRTHRKKLRWIKCAGFYPWDAERKIAETKSVLIMTYVGAAGMVFVALCIAALGLIIAPAMPVSP